MGKFHDFGFLAWFCDLVVFGVKNENLGFGKLGAAKKPSQKNQNQDQKTLNPKP